MKPSLIHIVRNHVGKTTMDVNNYGACFKVNENEYNNWISDNNGNYWAYTFINVSGIQYENRSFFETVVFYEDRAFETYIKEKRKLLQTIHL